MPELAKIIEFRDAVGDVLAARLPSAGEGIIEWGSQLIVREGQAAIFQRDGKSLASFGPGRYVLTTQNIPILTKFVTGLAYGRGKTPFRAEVYFVGTNLFRDLKWGTPEPVYIPDPILMQIPIRANGRYAIRVADPALFVPKIVGTRPVFRTSEIEDYLRAQHIVSALTDAVASLQKGFQELPRFYRELGIGVKALLEAEFASLGLELTELSVNSVSTTDEVRAILDRNAQVAGEAFARARGTQYELEAKAAGAEALARAGTNYQQVGMTDALKSAAANPGGGEGGGPMQTGMNLGLAMMVPQMMQQAMQAGGTVTPVASSLDPAMRLRQLKELLDLGAISQAEFDAKKAELLKLL